MSGAASKIVVEQACKLFQEGTVVAFRHLDLAVRERETLCIVGPSGCGKTTLLRSIAGLIPLSDVLLVVEPNAVSADGRLGMFFGHTFIVTDDGAECVDRFPWELTVV